MKLMQQTYFLLVVLEEKKGLYGDVKCFSSPSVVYLSENCFARYLHNGTRNKTWNGNVQDAVFINADIVSNILITLINGLKFQKFHNRGYFGHSIYSGGKTSLKWCNFVSNC